MKRLLLSLLLLAVGIVSAYAQPVVPSDYGKAKNTTACPYGMALPDGCPGAAPGGQFQNRSFFTTARQSGQDQYKAAGGKDSNHPPTWNVPGVDYAVGSTIPDSSLLDVHTNTPPGCTNLISAYHYISCAAGSDVEGYRFDDVAMHVASGSITFKNNHMSAGANTCLAFSGLDLAAMGDTSTIWNNTFDFGAACSNLASLYKQSGDPGLARQSTGTANISGSTLIYTGAPTGNVVKNQYVDCRGCTEPVQITAWNSGTLTATLSVSQPTLSGVSITTGPASPTFNAAIGSNSSSIEYNAFLGYQTVEGSIAEGPHSLRYNYWEVNSCCRQHNQFIAWLPGQNGIISPGNNLVLIQNFNTVLWPAVTAWNTGTSTMDTFATAPNANNASRQQIEYARVENNYNVLIANRTTNGGCCNTTNSLVRYLNQNGGVVAKIDFTLSGGVIDVASINSGGPLVVGDSIFCGFRSTTARSCNLPIKITSFGTGTGAAGTYNVLNNVDSTSSVAGGGLVYRYAGIIDSFQAIGNYMDATGTNGGAFTLDKGNVEVKTSDFSSVSNINMLSGDSCTPTSCR